MDIETGSCKAAPTIAGHGHAAHPTLGNRKDSDVHKTANDDDAGLKWVLEFERYLMDIEAGSCKAAPSIAGSTNETKTEVAVVLACKVAPTIADSTNKTENSDNTNETIKVPDNVTQKCAPSLRHFGR
jgi:hypothetical protein